MLDTLEMLNALLERAGALRPVLVAEKHALYRRGGYPARSMGDGPSGGETPLPVTQQVSARDSDGMPVGWYPVRTADSVDAELNRMAKGYAADIAGALRFLDAAIQKQSYFLKVAEPVPEEDPVQCENFERCGRWLDDGRKRGKCPACRQRESRANRGEVAS